MTFTLCGPCEWAHMCMQRQCCVPITPLSEFVQEPVSPELDKALAELVSGMGELQS